MTKVQEQLTVRFDGIGSSLPFSVSLENAAKLIGISRPSIYRLIDKGGFPCFKIGERTLVSTELLRQWVLDQCNINNSQESKEVI